MNNRESAEKFVAAIRLLASKPDNLDNIESYLATHFDKWIEKWASTPEGIAIEMTEFAAMEIG